MRSNVRQWIPAAGVVTMLGAILRRTSSGITAIACTSIVSVGSIIYSYIAWQHESPGGRS